MKEELRVTLIQAVLFWEDITANLAMWEEKLAGLSQQADLIVLPEMFQTGFSMKADKLAEHPNGHTTKWMKQMASKTGAVIAGSLMVRNGNNHYNCLQLVYPEGIIIPYYKRHLFGLAGENGVFTPGNQLVVADIKGWKVCPLVCYDLRFPVWSRNRFTDGKYLYDVQLFVANWPSSRQKAWDYLLKARSIENICYSIGVNIAGEDGNGLLYSGGSVVNTPDGAPLAEAGIGEEILTVKLNARQLNAHRTRFPFLQDADCFQLL